MNKPWLLLGEFNEIFLPSKSRGGAFIHSKATAFAEMVDECHLVDLGAYGGTFTWFRSNQGANKVAKRLDRAFGDVQIISRKASLPTSSGFTQIILRFCFGVALFPKRQLFGLSGSRQLGLFRSNTVQYSRMLGIQEVMML